MNPYYLGNHPSVMEPRDEPDEDLYYEGSRICVEPCMSKSFVNVNHLAQGPKPYFYDGPLDRHVVYYNRTKPCEPDWHVIDYYLIKRGRWPMSAWRS